MPTLLRTRLLLTAGLVCLIFAATQGDAARIEAIKGKHYPLRKQNGPWMIMVASLHEPPESRRGEGMSPDEAAAELVYELRAKGIPAYVYKEEEQQDEMNTLDRLGRKRSGRYRSQRESVCVLAGNYDSVETAEKSLKIVKKLKVDLFSDVKAENGEFSRLRNGGLFRKTPGQRNPLEGAFLTTNPLLSQSELAARQKDSLVERLNSGMDYSLLENPGKYTLVVATSIYKSSTKTDESQLSGALGKEVNDHLDSSAERAWRLTQVLREGNLPIANSKYRNFEAYVYHDRYKSVVTIGSFDSPNDPRIRELGEIFGAKYQADPQTGKRILVGEIITLPGETGPANSWIFDPIPRLMEVPQF